MARVVNVSEVVDTARIGALQWRTFLLCASVLFVDGFDVQGITYVAPAISQDWGLARGQLGPTFSAGLFGVMLGAMLVAPLADRVGRRTVIIWACVAFGMGSLATTWAGSLTSLLILRLFTGLGLGAALPNAVGLASEFAPRARRALVVMFVGSGISVGAIAAGMAAANLVAPFGWRSIFVAGGVLPLVLAGVLYLGLPESIRFAALMPRLRGDAARLLSTLSPGLDTTGDVRLVSDDAEHTRATVVDLFTERRAYSTLCLWVAFFMSLLNVYLAINWLPTSLNASGFTLAQANVMTSLYHVGGVVGTYAVGLSMDRLGVHRMVLVALTLAVASFYLFATATGLAQWPTTAVLFVAGMGVIGAQGGVLTLASLTYPVPMRATGLGWGLGVGRVGSIVGPTIGGVMLATAADPRSVYLVCIVPVLLGMIAVAAHRQAAHPLRQPVRAH